MYPSIQSGRTYNTMRLSNDTNGNPRYAVHFLSLGLTDYPDKTPKRISALGLRRFHNKQFGGGYVFQSYNLSESLDFYYNKINGAISLADLATKYRDWYATHKFF